MKKVITTFHIFLAIALLSSCTVGYSGNALEKQGIYECASKVKSDAPVFRFDSNSDSLVIHGGTKTYIEFFDLNSKKMVELHQDSYNYECTCVKEI